MGLKEWVRSRSKSRSRTSGEIKRSFSANEPYNASAPVVPPVPPTLSSDLGHRTPKQSIDYSNSQYRTSPGISTDRSHPSPASSTPFGHQADTPLQSGAMLGSVGSRQFSDSANPVTAHTSEGAGSSSVLHRGRSVQSSDGNPSYRYAGMNDQSAAPTSSSPLIANGNGSSTQRASIPSGHVLRHQADVPDLSREMTAHSQLDANGRSQTVSSNIDKPLPVPREVREGAWERQEPISLEQPLRFSGAQSNSKADGTPDKIAAISMQAGTRPDLDRPQNSVSNISSAEGLYTQYDEDELTPFATPAIERSHDAVQPFSQAEVKTGAQTAYDPNTKMAIKGASKPPDLRGIIDLTNTEDTTVQVRTAPTVVHEHIKPTVHHIRHEVVTREFHTHHYYHRILPVIDVEVLPARHYIHSKTHPGHLEEIPAEMLPQSTIDRYNNKHWVIAETVSKPSDTPLPGRRRFTAKKFAPGEGEHKEWVGEDGVPRTETTWIYPPVFNEVLYKEGLTQPVDIF